MISISAPGKIILFGEHAVVYGRPAIAAPVSQVRATAVAEPNDQAGIRLVAPDLGTDTLLAEADQEDPLAAAVWQVIQEVNLTELPDFTLTVTSQIPIASGLGSGAAISAAVIRSVAAFLGFSSLITNEWVSSLTYQVEKIHHGTPSGIDNTVVAYERPVYFVRRQPQNQIEPFSVAAPLRLLVADTGVSSSTKVVVGDVRRQWEMDKLRFEKLFDDCGKIAMSARSAIEAGDISAVGRLMNENQVLLRDMTVSCLDVEMLVGAAQSAGALGAKLSGAGRGGNMIALVTEETETAVTQALQAAGARSVLTSVIPHNAI